MFFWNERAPKTLAARFNTEFAEYGLEVISGANLFCRMAFALDKGAHLVTHQTGIFGDFKINHGSTLL
jgi:hypothetical protein